MNNYNTIQYISAVKPYFVWLLLICFILTGCSNVETPSNLEPKLIIGDATDITRTSSTISVEIDNPGTSKLSYIRFNYGEEGKMNENTENLISDEPLIVYELINLKPGTTYYYYAEGGTATASLRSETLSFSTFPNERPRVSKPEPLSTGPTGIVVEFEIEDDGGEEILEAGCEISGLSSKDSKRIYLPKDKLTEGKHQLYITDLALQTSYNITSFATNRSGESIGETLVYTTRNGIILREAGTLASLFGDSPLSLKALTISGDMNGSDFRFLRQLVGAPSLDANIPSSSVEELYLSDVNIAEGGESYDGSRFTENNVVSTGLFADCTKLKTIILPNSALAIKRDAFARTPLHETFNVPIEISELAHSSDCPKLHSIQVSEGNSHFSDIAGVVFNKSATEILWFPVGKTGHFTLPSSLKSIGENAFMGTHISSIEIPSSVTTIHRGAFCGSALEEIKLPDNLKNISEGMFQNCASLHTVRLGSDTEFIGDFAFDGTSLSSIYLAAQIPPFVSTDAFTNNSLYIYDNCTLFIPAGCKDRYRNHAKWNLFEHIVEY